MTAADKCKDLVTCDYCGALFRCSELAAMAAEVERLRTICKQLEPLLREVADAADVDSYRRGWVRAGSLRIVADRLKQAALTPTEPTP